MTNSFEFVILYKKYLFFFIITYLQIEIFEQTLIALIWIYIISHFLNRLSPFVTKEINNIAVLADIVIMGTLIFGLISHVTDNSPTYLFLLLIFYFLRDFM